ncbi:hypothetical protein BCR33DRAFT_714297 [Rhizoclosmatium globosum]|uniref:Uncharacterized protein n=1 Tax=Rhizoclosmatium globosum TaxID=329046 RepID=A0A1Y2CNU6_9FUNG|nr:hypothetical protein BCR33DRAFT_714297 [Rhizoclosmatium globosum]|eukprot:ORY48524.1 hypothetical protein BCR33DRAFT_714297 [Rhizoclosmatium globosum]
MPRSTQRRHSLGHIGETDLLDPSAFGTILCMPMFKSFSSSHESLRVPITTMTPHIRHNQNPSR